MAPLNHIHQRIEDESTDSQQGIVNRKRRIVNPKLAYSQGK